MVWNHVLKQFKLERQDCTLSPQY